MYCAITHNQCLCHGTVCLLFCTKLHFCLSLLEFIEVMRYVGNITKFNGHLTRTYKVEVSER